jgi:hypothetical protein
LTRSPLALVVAATMLLAAGGPAPAGAAPPQLLGQTAVTGTFGSCGHCSVVQFANSAVNNTYVVPSSGVLTKVQVRVGTPVDVTDWVQARTFRTSGAPDARVISEGTQHSLAGLSAGVQTFLDRVPVTAGDVLGGRFHVLSRPDATPAQFATTSPADLAGISFLPDDPAVGDLFSVESPVPSQYRVNMFAVLESDADGDSYGDTSQDLCPSTAAAATTACSGTLFGSRLQGQNTGAGNCGYSCLRVQKTISGASTAAAVDGVVVRWRVQAATAGSYRVRVVAPASGAGYSVLRSSAVETVTADPSPLKQAISTFETRLPIPAGGYVGLAPPQFAVHRGIFPALGATYVQLNDAADGITFGGLPVNGELFYDADIEPDADHDGYGDVTQDACPSDGSTQGPCPMPVHPTPTPVPTPMPTPTPDPTLTTPVISGLSAAYARFRVKRRGAVVARRRAHAGTTLNLRLSEAATVAFTVQRRVACKPARRRCTGWVFVHAFKRSLAAGPGSVPYSGRYRRSGKVRLLKPGAYRMSAVATNPAGRASAAKRIRLTVRR